MPDDIDVLGPNCWLDEEVRQHIHDQHIFGETFNDTVRRLLGLGRNH